MICGKCWHTLNNSGKYPCGACKKGVKRNSIFCISCDAWIHKKCIGIKGRLVDVTDSKCRRCLGLERPIDGRPVEHVSLGDRKLEVVDPFVYLGDGISPSGVVRLAPLQKSVLLGEIS